MVPQLLNNYVIVNVNIIYKYYIQFCIISFLLLIMYVMCRCMYVCVCGFGCGVQMHLQYAWQYCIHIVSKEGSNVNSSQSLCGITNLAVFLLSHVCSDLYFIQFFWTHYHHQLVPYLLYNISYTVYLQWICYC